MRLAIQRKSQPRILRKTCILGFSNFPYNCAEGEGVFAAISPYRLAEYCDSQFKWSAWPRQSLFRIFGSPADFLSHAIEKEPMSGF